ncbi:PREDICTED: interferon-inducible double-stranded RNA-dependent protein kinase activator A homolog isoform X1 [Polistes dominula]|uniref:Interferon-inducible double-stranded RNA-dependent protein kinase activator A homolog isoform X1 n=1 Tax=Polistes dominula TaxID=743375 RepID=A0ABM1I6E7_POLDO|nr:PREDICTED: interferon-inducible double-stranded RNA-dependent protein kinase activator A homolog isoform X1 [Polistes dominula]
MMVNVGNVSTHSSNSHRRSKARLTLQAMMSDSLSLSEAARLEMEALPNKTPVSVLQELLSRRGTIPKYELVQVEGVIHEPTFRYRVTVGDVIAMGTGRSKKEAKHAAAKAVLDNLIGTSNESSESAIIKSLTNQAMQDLEGYGEEKDIANPIGVLQEMCVSRHFPPPKYTMENEEGLPHERKFTIVCSIMSLREYGHGKSKKIAKRHAAHKMWRLLNESGPSILYKTGEEKEKGVKLNTYYCDLKGSKVSTLSSSHSHKVSQFHKNLKASQGAVLDKLQDTCLNDGDINLVQFLQEIASEQRFEVTYVDIEERSVNGKCQCLVQLSTLPVAVCYGCGVTSNDAQASAAQNALEYLKIMTKK